MYTHTHTMAYTVIANSRHSLCLLRSTLSLIMQYAVFICSMPIRGPSLGFQHEGMEADSLWSCYRKTDLNHWCFSVIVEYSNGKVGVDVGDQKNRDRRAYADWIKSAAWSRKWGMHAIQQIRHQSFLCWQDIHGVVDGSEDICTYWENNGKGSDKVNWAFNVGLIKGILIYIYAYNRRVAKKALARTKGTKGVRCSLGEWEETNTTKEHTIVSRGYEYRNMQCAICAHERANLVATRICKRIPVSILWYSQPNCQAHVCKEHRGVIHDYAKNCVVLKKYHNLKRIKHTQDNPGKHPKPKKAGQGRKKEPKRKTTGGLKYYNFNDPNLQFTED